MISSRPATFSRHHASAHVEFPETWAVAGQVLQPGESSGGRGPRTIPSHGIRADLDFPFWSDQRAFVVNVMAGNLSVKRDKALAVGAFDENFEGVAYRFETEFARRLVRLGGQILFEPAASIRHLRSGGWAARSVFGKPFDIRVSALWHGRLLFRNAVGLEPQDGRIHAAASDTGSGDAVSPAAPVVHTGKAGRRTPIFLERTVQVVSRSATVLDTCETTGDLLAIDEMTRHDGRRSPCFQTNTSDPQCLSS